MSEKIGQFFQFIKYLDSFEKNQMQKSVKLEVENKNGAEILCSEQCQSINSTLPRILSVAVN